MRSPDPATCDLCGATMRAWRYVPVDCKKGTDHEHGRLVWCDPCRYGRVHPIPPPEAIAEFYDLELYYTQGASHFTSGASQSWLDRVRDHLAWRLDAGEPISAERIDAMLRAEGLGSARICDLGCGSGAMAAALADAGHRVTGVETDESALAGTHGERFEFMRGTAEDLPPSLEAGSFDAVVLSHTLEHFREPVRALGNVVSLLRPGGVVACEVPNNACLAAEHRGPAWEQADVPRHLHFFTEPSLRAAFERAGFAVERVWFSQFSRQFSNPWIATEAQLRERLASGRERPDPLPPANSRIRAWMLLARSLFAPAARRYDSVGLLARRPTA